MPFGDLAVEVGARLRELRRVRPINQTQVADAIGVTQGSISNYEAGIRDLPTWTLLAMLRVLDCPPAEFFSGIRGFVVPNPAQTEDLVDAARDFNLSDSESSA